MKKVLFLTWSYPNTSGSATILCTHRVLECVASSGKFEVHVLCSRLRSEAKEEVIGDIHVCRFKPSWWVRLTSHFLHNNKYRYFNRILVFAQKVLTIPIYPLISPITTIRYYLCAKKLQKRESYSIVVSEHHGLESLITGCLLMRKFKGLQHVAIFWDPLKGQIPTDRLPKCYTERRIDIVEHFVAKNTKLQISLKSIQGYYKLNGDIAEDHRYYLDIPGVLKPEIEVSTIYTKLLLKGHINIVFSGLLSEQYRDAIPIIRLFNKCEKAERINLVFFSRGEKDPIEKEAERFRGRIVYHDYIPLKELHTIYRHVDFLLNISHMNSNMVPSKIFEYMSYGKPIISTYVTEGDSAQKYINRYPDGLCIDLKKTEEENVVALNSFFENKHSLISYSKVKEVFGDNTPERFLEVLDRL